MKSKTILLIDDDEDDRLLFLDALCEIDKSIQCQEVNDGLEAILLLRTRSVLPDLIFLDLNMPKMNGYDCLTEIKKEARFNSIPVIIYTTTNVLSEKMRTLQMGAKHFFTKPSDFAMLSKELTKILKKEFV